jgi:hypothetical protein
LSSWFDDKLPYADAWATHVHQQTQYFLGSWISVVNHYLQEHRHAVPDRTTEAIVQSLDYALRLHFSDDDWDVETTAALLTERLREYYTSQSAPPADEVAYETPTTSPAMLLTQIARINGKIPDFVRERRPRAEEATDKLAAFERMLSEGVSRQQFYRDIEKIESLIEVAPYHAIKLAVGENNLKEGIDVLELLDAIASPKVRRSTGHESLPPTDPMLLLAVLADLVGQGESQDDRIAGIFGQRHPSRIMRRHINDILSGPWAMRKVVHDLLKQMADRSKSARLTGEIRRLDPTAVDQTATGTD